MLIYRMLIARFYCTCGQRQHTGSSMPSTRGQMEDNRKRKKYDIVGDISRTVFGWRVIWEIELDITTEVDNQSISEGFKPPTY
jgi:hypothetical protein